MEIKEILGAMREPMSKVDTAWLHMERPTNLMMITGVLMLKQKLGIRRLKDTIRARWLSFRRFSQKVLELPGQSFWEVDPHFDIDSHVRRAALPEPAGKVELEEYVSLLASTPLDPSKPLWQFHLIENYDGGSAVVIRVHHCYADGIALVQVLLSLTDTDPEADPARPHPKEKLQSSGGTVFDRLLSPARQGVENAVHLVESVVAKASQWVRHPQSTAEHAAELARMSAREGSEIMRELVHSLTLPDDPPTLFKGPLGVAKRVAWCEPLPLHEVKAVGKALGCTVNDVLLASVSGALRSYLIDAGEDVQGLTIRATVPVNLRPLEHAKELGNHFGLVFLDLPIGESHPLTRLIRVRDAMAELKHSRQALVSYGLLSALGMGPGFLQQPALELLSRKATAVATNVPGPQAQLYLAGAAIGEMMFWVPQTGSIGMGISILSYHNKVHFGLITDARLVPVPGEIITRFGPELEKLLLIALMEDWTEPITPDGAAQTLRRYARSPSTGARPAKSKAAKQRAAKAAPAPRRPGGARRKRQG